MQSEINLIFVSLENWDEIWRRNQLICAELARRQPKMRILFVAPPRDISHRIRRGQLFSNTRPPVASSKSELQNITVTRPLKLFPNSIGLGRKFNEILVRNHVRRISRRLGFRTSVLWLNPHYAVHMAGRIDECALIYDITDDWTTLTQSTKSVELIRRQDAELCRIADATIVCSQRLYEMKQKLARALHLIPNGVDASHYARVLKPGLPLPAQATVWPKPVLGYTGTIHPDRVDVELLMKLAAAHRGSLVLIGPNYLQPKDLASLRQCSNIFLPGPIPYAQIPDYMAAFDVCITPHKMTAFTESLNPIKLWEYLAAGLPIVSTDVAGFRDYPDLVHLARTPDEFIAATKVALAEGTSKTQLRQRESAKHSWARRVDQIESVIASCLERRRSSSAKLVAPADAEVVRAL